jgi:hypothetical protein
MVDEALGEHQGISAAVNYVTLRQFGRHSRHIYHDLRPNQSDLLFLDDEEPSPGEESGSPAS